MLQTNTSPNLTTRRKDGIGLTLTLTLTAHPNGAPWWLRPQGGGGGSRPGYFYIYKVRSCCAVISSYFSCRAYIHEGLISPRLVSVGILFII